MHNVNFKIKISFFFVSELTFSSVVSFLGRFIARFLGRFLGRFPGCFFDVFFSTVPFFDAVRANQFGLGRPLSS